jgi:hypothetical protein
MLRELHSNGCFCGSTVLAWSINATVFLCWGTILCVCLWRHKKTTLNHPYKCHNKIWTGPYGTWCSITELICSVQFSIRWKIQGLLQLSSAAANNDGQPPETPTAFIYKCGSFDARNLSLFRLTGRTVHGRLSDILFSFMCISPSCHSMLCSPSKVLTCPQVNHKQHLSLVLGLHSVGRQHLGSVASRPAPESTGGWAM